MTSEASGTGAAAPNPVEAPSHVHELLHRLHRESENQERTFNVVAYTAENVHDAARDKFIALDQDKCQCVYQICRAINAKNVVEAGTSFGVSTIYLSLAVNKNIEATGGTGTVIGTEHEPSKADRARAYWLEAGEAVSQRIDLRIGDLRETLKSELPLIDLLLIDIWAPMTLPALKVVQPRLRYGAVVIIDNTIKNTARYEDLLTYLRAPGSGFINLTLPYKHGLEISLYTPAQK